MSYGDVINTAALVVATLSLALACWAECRRQRATDTVPGATVEAEVLLAFELLREVTPGYPEAAALMLDALIERYGQQPLTPGHRRPSGH
jgi:hypothetical protein